MKDKSKRSTNQVKGVPEREGERERELLSNSKNKIAQN